MKTEERPETATVFPKIITAAVLELKNRLQPDDPSHFPV
jgi:hypothetical protein